MINPDGFNFTFGGDRLWRKTRSLNNNGCIGVDPNRNFPFQWNSGGSSNDPCSETFHGNNPLSEIELKLFTDYITTIPNLKFFIDFHSYGQLIMRPYSYSSQIPINEIEAKYLNDKVASFVNLFGKSYISGRVTEVLYIASGSSTDWVYNKYNAISLAFELRPDSSSNGFLVEPGEIIPTGNEIFSGIISACKILLKIPLN